MNATNEVIRTTEPIPNALSGLRLKAENFFAGSNGQLRERVSVKMRAFRAEAAEDDRLERPERQPLADAPHRDRRCPLRREAVDAGRDCREGDALEAVPGGDFERAAIAARQNHVLAGAAAAPDRADRVDDVPRRQPITLRDLGVARRAAVQRPARGEKLGTRGAMDGAVDAAAAQQRGVPGVDDRIEVKPREFAQDDVQGRAVTDSRRGRPMHARESKRYAACTM